MTRGRVAHAAGQRARGMRDSLGELGQPELKVPVDAVEPAAATHRLHGIGGLLEEA